MKCALVVAVFAVCSAMVVAMPQGPPPGAAICPPKLDAGPPPLVQISQPKLNVDGPPSGVQICPLGPPPPGVQISPPKPDRDAGGPPPGVQICPPGPAPPNFGENGDFPRPMTLEFLIPLDAAEPPPMLNHAYPIRPIISRPQTLDLKFPIIRPAIGPAMVPIPFHPIHSGPYPLRPIKIRPINLIRPLPAILPANFDIERPIVGNARPLNLVIDAEAHAPHIAVCPSKPADEVKVADVQVSEPKPAEA